MSKIAFLLMTTPYTMESSDTVIKLAQAALEEGHEITGIYLYSDGVYNANKSIDPKSEEERNIAQLFKDLADKGVPIRICPVCSNYRGLPDEQLFVEGAEFDGLAGFAEMFEDADKVIAFTS
ncbi:MAG: DsrE/DsrF/TusD sulfur relay family protein [Candidatus Odinarchaeia archaeon]